MVAGTQVNGQVVKQVITDDAWGKIKAGTVGSYDSNIEVDNASGTAQVASTGGKVIVVPDNAVINGTDAAYAGTKTYTVSEAKALNAQTALYEAQGCYGVYQGTAIAAADMAGNAHVSQGIVPADWDAITKGTVGTYASNITIGSATSNTGKIIVVPDGAVVDPATNTSVSAQTVTLTPAQAKALTAATDLYSSSLNNVSGYIDGTAIASGDITTKAAQTFANATDWTVIKAGKLGTYSVTYTTTSVADPTKSASKTVHVIVAGSSGSKDGVVVTANDFWIQRTDAAVDDGTLVTLSKATGFDTATTPDTALTAQVDSRGSLDTSRWARAAMSASRRRTRRVLPRPPPSRLP